MDTTDAGIEFRFAGQAIEWRGPAPHVFVPLPADVADHLAENRPLFSYG